MTIMRARVSLCIPVRNNERTIEKCISSVADVIDELVILDSGSTDRTLDIAGTFGAEIHHITWPDDYSEVYNQLFSYAKNDYILFMHSDEFLCDSSRDPLKTLLTMPILYKKNTILFKRKDIDRFNDHVFMGREIFMWRIFQKNAGFWRFPVHEIFFQSGPSINSNIILYHDHQMGFLSEKQKHKNYRKILENFLASDPVLSDGEACRLFMLKASDHLAIGEFDQALEDFNQAVRFGQKSREKSTDIWLRRSYLGKGLLYYQTEKYDRAAEMFFLTDDFPDTLLEKYYFLAKISLARKKREEAFNYFRLALDNRAFSDSCFFFIPFRLVFHLMLEALDTARELGYKDKEKELSRQLDVGFGKLLPLRNEVRLFPE